MPLNKLLCIYLEHSPYAKVGFSDVASKIIQASNFRINFVFTPLTNAKLSPTRLTTFPLTSVNAHSIRKISPFENLTPPETALPEP